MTDARELELARELAFAGRFASALAVLDRCAPGPEATWIHAYIDAARGDFERAERLARSSLDAPEPVRSRAMLTLGSILRQTGRHADAEPLDQAVAAHPPDEDARAHARIGLVADAVGVGDADAAAERLDAARASAAGADWRVQVRAAWVETEVALLRGTPEAAIGPARRALELSIERTALRHQAKSYLFLGVALHAAADDTLARADAASMLGSAAALAARIGARPVADVAEALLAGRNAGAPG